MGTNSGSTKKHLTWPALRELTVMERRQARGWVCAHYFLVPGLQPAEHRGERGLQVCIGQ